MAFIKRGSATVATPPAEGVAKLSTEAQPADQAKLQSRPVRSAPAGRDFDAEARGKTRCALEEAWAQSPLLPMLVKDPNDRAELHLILDEIVTERMKRVFPNG